MPPPSRRIFLYWLLLLIPALVVGLGAIQLLRREQARVAQQGAYAVEARQTAAGARARLIVENIELLTGDVQNGLLDTLSAEPPAGLDAFLDDWEKNNPLVRLAFTARSDGSILRPDAGTRSEEARGFLRRFAALFQRQPPWGESAQAGVKDVAQRSPAALADERARGALAANVAQVQSARRDVQELVKARDYRSSGAADSLAQKNSAAAQRRNSSMPSSAPTPLRAEASDLASAGGRGVEPLSDRRGWLAVPVDGHVHLLGWVIPPGSGNIRGLELDSAALVSRLAGGMPAEVAGGEGFVLRDGQGHVVHQVGLVPRSAELVLRVPIASSLLPGWEVAGYVDLGHATSADPAAIFWTGALLVATFVTAIVAGGSLLLWQARRSDAEAAQKTSFVANVSHEFKTPLTTIRLYAELLEQRRVRDAAQGAEYLRTIGRETQRLARLVNNVLDFSRLEQGRKRFSREELDVGATVNALLDTHAPRIAEAGLRLERSVPPAPVIAVTDRDAFEQIVINLVDNACKYAAAGGELVVAVQAPQGGGLVVRVGDRGPGVPAGQREKIFEKFHRLDDKLTAEKTGAGLGLSIARQLARGLGGDLRCVARDGGGAEFILELPTDSS